MHLTCSRLDVRGLNKPVAQQTLLEIEGVILPRARAIRAELGVNTAEHKCAGTVIGRTGLGGEVKAEFVGGEKLLLFHVVNGRDNSRRERDLGKCHAFDTHACARVRGK
jgi:hypothetical protein